MNQSIFPSYKLYLKLRSPLSAAFVYCRLISEVLPFGRLWYDDINALANAIGYAEHYSRSHDAVIRVCNWTDDVVIV